MKLDSLFNKRNYKYLFFKLKFYPKSVYNKSKNYSEVKDIYDLIEYFEVNKFKSIAVVASGPSSKKIILEKDILYISTNDSQRLVNKANFIYIIQDQFYLQKYLKTFKDYVNWKGTVFFLEDNNLNQPSYFKINRYLSKRSRRKKEFLISNIKNKKYQNTIFNQFDSYLQNNIKLNYECINSGFMCVQIAYVFSFLTNKPLIIYGLDMGVGGETYYNLKSSLGKSIKSDVNKEKVAKVLNAMYKSNVNVINNSNFMRNEL